MKKTYLFQFLIVFLTFLVSGIKAETFEIRTVQNAAGYLEVQMRETSGIGTPTATTPISLINFQIRWSTALGTDIDVLCSSYNIADGLGSIQTTGGYNWRTYYAESTPFDCPVDWVVNEWQPIASFKVTTSSGTGTFEVAPHLWVPQGCSWGQGDPAVIYHPTVNGSAADYPYPTLVYDKVWIGTSNRWNTAGNWNGTCVDGTGSGVPTTAQNVLIPDVDDENDNAFNPSTATADLSCKALTIASGGWLTVPATRKLNATGATKVEADGKLDFLASTTINTLTSVELKPSAVRAAGVMTIYPGAKVTLTGALTLSAPSQLVILANSTQVGSLRDNGTINYLTGGSANVQTYIKNSAAPGAYYAHLVGPTVNDPAFQTFYGYPGVYLQAFDLGVASYAYEYAEPTNSWVNIYSNTDDVRSTKGILMSTVDQTDHTLTMTGQLVTGTISSAPLSYTTNQLELLSNPYASALDFNLFQPANSGAITNKYYAYDASIGTYKTWQIGVGGTAGQFIPVGQGFFVETTSTSSVSFTNAMRTHYNTGIFKDIFPYQLKLDLAGNGFGDATFINFTDGGSTGYDASNDTYKWMSIQPEASEFWTVASDQSLLTMNSLPSLGNGLVSVPLSFECNAEGIHTIIADNISSFDQGTEIYLEDIVSGNEWHNLVQNPIYEFTGSPSDDQSRFIVHFFGPTGINDPDGSGLIDIYAWGQDAYIVNRGKETVKEYVVYDLMGRELHRGTLPNNTVNKVTIGDVSAYYIVKVITKEGRIYNDKVYITK